MRPPFCFCLHKKATVRAKPLSSRRKPGIARILCRIRVRYGKIPRRNMLWREKKESFRHNDKIFTKLLTNAHASAIIIFIYINARARGRTLALRFKEVHDEQSLQFFRRPFHAAAARA